MFKLNVNELLFALLFSYAILRFTVYFHELGHAFALLVSKYTLKSKTKLDIQIIVCGFYGKTYSPLYQELTLPLIRLNAIMGYVFELLLYLTVGIFILLAYFKTHGTLILLNKFIFVFIINFLTLFVVTLSNVFTNTSDIKWYKEPQNFYYSDKITKVDTYYKYINTAYYFFSLIAYVFAPLSNTNL